MGADSSKRHSRTLAPTSSHTFLRPKAISDYTVSMATCVVSMPTADRDWMLCEDMDVSCARAVCGGVPRAMPSLSPCRTHTYMPTCAHATQSPWKQRIEQRHLDSESWRYKKLRRSRSFERRKRHWSSRDIAAPKVSGHSWYLLISERQMETRIPTTSKRSDTYSAPLGTLDGRIIYVSNNFTRRNSFNNHYIITGTSLYCVTEYVLPDCCQIFRHIFAD